jgi:UPF0716 family protein affecting phage T7 exclusion
VGGGLVLAGIAGLFLWRSRCKKTFCQVTAELAVVVSVVLVPIISWIANISFLTPCLNSTVAGFVSALSVAVALALANCAVNNPDA